MALMMNQKTMSNRVGNMYLYSKTKIQKGDKIRRKGITTTAASTSSKVTMIVVIVAAGVNRHVAFVVVIGNIFCFFLLSIFNL